MKMVFISKSGTSSFTFFQAGFAGNINRLRNRSECRLSVLKVFFLSGFSEELLCKVD